MIWAGFATYLLGVGAWGHFAERVWVNAAVAVPAATFCFYRAYAPFSPEQARIAVPIIFLICAASFTGMSWGARRFG
jgi:hypothetical protein